MKKLIAILMTIAMLLSTAAVFAEETDWSTYTDWMNVDWDAKTIKYQFTGVWEDLDHGFRYQYLINLYEDGSVLVDQFNSLNATGYQQFGFWSEEADEDGNCITLKTLFCTPNPGETELVAHEYEYELYEEEDGGYSFGYTFGVAAGRYFRTVDVTGSAEIKHESVTAFEDAVKEVKAE